MLPGQPNQQVPPEAAELYFPYTRSYGTMGDPFTTYSWQTPEFQTKLLNALFLAESLDDKVFSQHAVNYLEPDMLTPEDQMLVTTLFPNMPSYF